MLLSLRSLQHGHEHIEKQFASSLFPAGDSETFRVVSPVSLSFDIDGQETGRYRVKGHVSGDLELACSRCLEPFTMRVATEFDLCYVPRTENVGEGEREVEEDDLATSFYDEHQIDLGLLITEQFQLALPMKPLCVEACRGLCLHCGGNLNTTSCACNQKWEDPRLAALRALARPETDTQN